MPDTHVIVGGGLAGAKAAEALRREGFDGRIVLVAAENELPYERPPLSKGYLRGESPRERVQVHSGSFYADNDIELRLHTRADGLDVARRKLSLAGGERIGFDRLLIATGARPRRLRVPGIDLDGIHYLRDLADADALAPILRPGARAVVVGGGWIGAEVAASARQKGVEVTLVTRAELPLQHVLGDEVAAVYAALHRENGVRLIAGATVDAFEGAGRVERVRLAGGTALDADLVVVGVGAVPRAELAEAAGLAVGNGILVDERLETSAPGIFAAGDVASAHHPFYGRRLRVEHWASALNQGQAAAKAMLGEPVSYERLPYFYSDQYDVGMEYSGHAPSWDEVAFEGDPGSREFIAWWLKDGRVVAGMNVNVWDVTAEIQRLIRSGASKDELSHRAQHMRVGVHE